MPMPRPWVVGGPIQGAKPVANQLFGTLPLQNLRPISSCHEEASFSIFQRRLPSAEIKYLWLHTRLLCSSLDFTCLLAGWPAGSWILLNTCINIYIYTLGCSSNTFSLSKIITLNVVNYYVIITLNMCEILRYHYVKSGYIITLLLHILTLNRGNCYVIVTLNVWNITLLLR